MSRTVIVEISDIDQLTLENDLLDLDDWVQKAVTGKIQNCKKRFIRDWQPRLFNDPNVTEIPATPEAFILSVVARDDYQNRVARDAAEAVAREGVQ